MAQSDKKQKVNVQFVVITQIYRVRDEKHPLFDPRILEALDNEFLADVGERGITHAVHLVTRESLKARLGIDIPLPFTEIDGRHRINAAEQLSMPYVKAEIVECPSTVHEFLTWAKRSNTMREQETLANMVEFARRIHAQGGTVESIQRTFRKPKSTVETWLKLAEPGVLAPETQKMLENDQLTLATGQLLASKPVDVQQEILQEIKPSLNEAMTSPDGKSSPVKDENGQNIGARPRPAAEVKENSEGKPVPVPTLTNVEQAAKNVENRRRGGGPRKPKEGSADSPKPAVIEAAFVQRLVAMSEALGEEINAMPNDNKAEGRAYLAGFLTALARLQGNEPEGIPESVMPMFRVIFPAKKEEKAA